MPGARGRAASRSADTPGRRTRRSIGVDDPGRAECRAPPWNSGGPAWAQRSATGRPRTRGTGTRRFRAALPPARRARPARARPCRECIAVPTIRRPPPEWRRATDRRMRPPRKRKNPGDGLFSRKAALSVSSALESLTSVFGMGTGVASPLESPGFRACGSRFGSGSAALKSAAGAGREIFNFASFGRPRTPRWIPIHDAGPWSALERSSPRPLVRLGCTRCRASTCRLSSR